MKGAIAKENVINKIITALGEDYIGEFDKKYYCWADDGNDRVQISISLSHPKVYRGVEETSPVALNFDDDEEDKNIGTTFKPADITQEETDNLVALMAKLGL